MSREIKFRGKRKDNGEWVYGFYDGCYETATINYLKKGIPYNACIIPETLGQFTGLHDKNGKEIYEGDVMPVWEQGEEYHYKVIYDGDCSMLAMLDSNQGSYPLSTKNLISEVIGNIYDNPELQRGVMGGRRNETTEV